MELTKIFTLEGPDGKKYQMSMDMKTMYLIEKEFNVSLTSNEGQKFFDNCDVTTALRVMHLSMWRSKNEDGSPISFDDAVEVLSQFNMKDVMMSLGEMMSGASGELPGSGKKGKNPTKG
jgi:hypothetical protein